MKLNLKKSLLLVLMCVGVMVAQRNIFAQAKDRETILTEILSYTVMNEEIPYEEADKILTELEAKVLEQPDLSTGTGFLKAGVLPEGLELSHGQEIELIGYLKTYYESKKGVYLEDSSGNNFPAYNKIIRDYELPLVAQDDVDTGKLNGVIIHYQKNNEVKSLLTYAYYDVNADGMDELLILYQNKIADMYTLVDDEAYQLFETNCLAERCSLTLYNDQTMVHYGPGGASIGGYNKYKLDPNANKTTEIDSFKYNIDTNPNAPFFRPSQPDKLYTEEEFKHEFELDPAKEIDLASLEQHRIMGTEVPYPKDDKGSTTPSKEEVSKEAPSPDVKPSPLVDDWYLESPRSRIIPQAVWPFMSIYNEDRTLVVEPIFHDEKVISGYSMPNTDLQIMIENEFGQDIKYYDVTTDAKGYYEFASDTIHMGSRIGVSAVSADIPAIDIIYVYQLMPTPLAHESGKLTLERYFMDQDYIEGQTFPNAKVTAMQAGGYGGNMVEEGVSDADGHFKFDVPPTTDKRFMLEVSVTDPENGQTYKVVPFPWTQEEFANVKW